MIFFKKDGFSLIFKVAYLVKDEQCLFAEDLKLTSGNCCLLCMLMCVCRVRRMRMSLKQASQSWTIFNIDSLCLVLVALEDTIRINHYFKPPLHSLKSRCHKIVVHSDCDACHTVIELL